MIGDHGVERAGLVARARAAIAKAGHEVAQLTELDGEPGADAIDRAAGIGRDAKATIVATIGGGSALDLAKLTTVAGPADYIVTASGLMLSYRPA